MRAQYESQGVGFLALSIDPDLSEVTEAAQKLGLRFQVASGPGDVMHPFGVRQVPDTIYLDASGKVVAFDKGPQGKAQFEKQVKALLAAK
ncbi:MAG: hypothetical protein JST54_07265 [Deltaproteobacteria bacterium]|nr:hypothetical protein [Deltaproteobacteria bacterium]